MLMFGLILIVIMLWFIGHSLSAMADHLARINAQLERAEQFLPDQIAEAVAGQFSWRLEEIHNKLTVIANQGEQMKDRLHDISISALEMARASGD
jgi:hypothetical protein